MQYNELNRIIRNTKEFNLKKGNFRRSNAEVKQKNSDNSFLTNKNENSTFCETINQTIITKNTKAETPMKTRKNFSECKLKISALLDNAISSLKDLRAKLIEREVRKQRQNPKQQKNAEEKHGKNLDPNKSVKIPFEGIKGLKNIPKSKKIIIYKSQRQKGNVLNNQKLKITKHNLSYIYKNRLIFLPKYKPE